jgi:hypothetical protein
LLPETAVLANYAMGTGSPAEKAKLLRFDCAGKDAAVSKKSRVVTSCFIKRSNS